MKYPLTSIPKIVGKAETGWRYKREYDENRAGRTFTFPKVVGSFSLSNQDISEVIFPSYPERRLLILFYHCCQSASRILEVPPATQETKARLFRVSFFANITSPCCCPVGQPIETFVSQTRSSDCRMPVAFQPANRGPSVSISSGFCGSSDLSCPIRIRFCFFFSSLLSCFSPRHPFFFGVSRRNTAGAQEPQNMGTHGPSGLHRSATGNCRLAKSFLCITSEMPVPRSS